jgi:transposase
MAYIKGESREQLTLTPMCLDDYIGKNNICRVIDAFVRSLDMTELGFKYAKTKETGRPPHDPAHMLMLYVYGYLNRIRSSRRLEAEAHRNIEVMWLMEKLTPDDKTICNFRKDNAKALKKVFRQFSLWCSEQDLYGRELVAVDGSKFRANANRKSIHTQKGTTKKLAEVEKKISEYMNELERNDNAEADDAKLDLSRIPEVLKRLNERKETLQEWLKKINENNGKEISTVDLDAHLMHTNGDGRNLDACYNVQTVVDEKHKLIVDFDVTTCPDDKGSLVTMTESAKEIMGVNEIKATADKGYYDGEDIKKCEQNGTICYIPKTKDNAPAPDANYNKSNFSYDAKNDCYVCPEGQILPFRQFNKRQADKEPDRVYYDTKVCRVCPNKEKCTTNKRDGRKIYRNSNQDTLDVNNARMKTEEGRETFRERKKIIEHPFGTTKAVWGFKQFLCRGQEKTSGEASLVFLAYNLRRVINIFKENERCLVAAMA